MLSVNTNISALSSQQNTYAAQQAMETNMERLSSGKRINGSADDAAGIQIVERFNSQLKGINMAERNANDGISVAQTAEAALGNVQDMLQRMRELAVQSSNAALNDSDRSSLNAELDQLVEEINQIGERTMFNNNKLLDGTYKDRAFQIGANGSETMDFNLGSVKADTLGVTNKSSLSSMGPIAGSAISLGDVRINSVDIGPSLENYDTASYVDKDKSAISKAAAINAKSSETGVTATVNTNEVRGAGMGAVNTTESGTIKINGKTIEVSVIANNTSATRAAVVSAINAKSGETGVIAVDTDSDKTGVKLLAADGRNIEISFSSALTTADTGIEGSTSALVHYGSYSLSSSEDIVVTRGANNTADAIDNTGLREGTYSTQESTISSIADSGSSWASGDVVINGIQIRETRGNDDAMSTGDLTDKTKSAIAKVAAINDHAEDSGVWATVNANKVDGGDMSSLPSGNVDAGRISINGVTTQSITTTGDAANNRELVVAAINSISDRTGVIAIDTGKDDTGIQLVAEDGRNIKTSLGGSLQIDSTGLQAASATTYEGSFTLHSAKAIEISTQNVVNFDTDNDFANTGTYGNGISGESIDRIDINSSKNALSAIEAIDNALEQINEMRGDLGAKQNRLEYTISNLQSTAENMNASRSRIEDADFATESTALAKNKILQQASMAMLAQANQSAQGVMKLLQ